MKSELEIDAPFVLLNGVIVEITTGEEEKRGIVNFDQTNHSFSTMCNGGGGVKVSPLE